MTKAMKSSDDERVRMAEALKACLEYLRRDALEADLAVTAEMLMLAIEGAAMDLEKLAHGAATGRSRPRRAESARADAIAKTKPLRSVLARRA
jgi:hypothetical protein